MRMTKKDLEKIGTVRELPYSYSLYCKSENKVTLHKAYEVTTKIAVETFAVCNNCSEYGKLKDLLEATGIFRDW